MNEQVAISIPIRKIEEHKKRVSKREKELNRIVDEAIQSTELAPDIFLQLEYLRLQIMNETFVHPICVAYQPFGNIAERLENHIHSLEVPIRLLALKNVLKEIKKVGYAPSVDFNSLKSYVAYKSNFPIYISKGNNCFCITIDEKNIYVIPLGKKPHDRIEYPHIEIPFLPQVISSYK